jgi:hypothetical protein
LPRIELVTDVHRPPAQVFEALTTLDNAGKWMPGFVEIEKLTPGPFGVGTRWREVRKVSGQRAEEVFEVTEHQPPSRLGVKFPSKVAPGDAMYSITPMPGGTTVRLDMDVRIKGIARLFSPLFTSMMKSQIRKDMDALKAYVESRP